MPENLFISYETLDFGILNTHFSEFYEENLIKRWIADHGHYLQSKYRHDMKHS